MSHDFSHDSGRLLERKAFGRCSWRFEGYLFYEQALEMVRKHQPSQETAFVRTLRIAVAEQLGVRAEAVKFITAVGENPMDRNHKVDAFIEANGATVSIDITKQEDKAYKADVLMVPGDVDHPLAVAGMIARHLVSKTRRTTYWRAP